MSDQAPFRLVVGLGNPGSDYQGTRHNIGFQIVEKLTCGETRWRTKFKSEYLELTRQRRTVAIIKPQTYMNLSGEAVSAWAEFFKITPAEILVVHDDIDLNFARIKLSLGGGDGGHNGLKSIAQQLGSRDFARVRVGVGRPFYSLPVRPTGDAADWVLSQFSSEERPALSELIEQSVAAIEEALVYGFRSAQMKFNREEKPEDGA